ncbi:hypothetical protein [Phascolarctobacterium succinatutens]|uniref:hypothetical protein n=1 Tax=Phascolarctobacterium succinatutens TaxID=626940 RepID=UPI003076BEE1
MDQLNSNTQHQNGNHLSFEERVIIQTRLKDNSTPSEQMLYTKTIYNYIDKDLMRIRNHHLNHHI